MRDRTDQATGTATSYAVAAGLFAAAGIFLIAALLVGATALFRWIEINYGLFPAFGATGGLLVVIAAICAGVAASRLKRPAPQFPSLASRLRVAINANPIKPARVEAATNTATAILREPATPVSGASRARRTSRPGPVVDSRKMQAGLLAGGDIVGLGGRATAAGATNGALMSARRSEAADNLLLVAATAIFVLTAQRYLQTITAPEPAREPEIAPAHRFAPEIAQPGRGRLSSNPFQIPLAGWKDILWRT